MRTKSLQLQNTPHALCTYVVANVISLVGWYKMLVFIEMEMGNAGDMSKNWVSNIVRICCDTPTVAD